MSATSPLMGGAGYALKLPVIDVSEVGAGGGTIVRVDSGRRPQGRPRERRRRSGPRLLRPRRQASRPSPTPTSCSATSTRVRSPAAPCRSMPQAARRAIADRIATPLGRDLVETAYGIHLVANTNMMRAVKAVTTNRGRDTRDFVMFAFGGSGGVHAASLARELRIARIVVPPAAGVFSALGLLFADLELNESRACLRRLAALSQDEMDRAYDDLAEGIAARLGRSRAEVTLPAPRRPALRRPGLRDHRAPAGRPLRRRGAQGARTPLRRRARGALRPLLRGPVCARGGQPAPRRQRHAVGRAPHRLARSAVIRRRGGAAGLFRSCRTACCATPVISRSRLDEKPRQGPLVIEEYEGTVVVPPDATAARDADGNILIDLAVVTQ